MRPPAGEVRIARAIYSSVVFERDNRSFLLSAAGRGHDGRRALLRVQPDLSPVLVRQPARVVQSGLVDDDPADVVKQRPEAELPYVLALEAGEPA